MGSSISTVLPHGIVGVSQRKHRAEVKQRRTKTHLTHPLYLFGIGGCKVETSGAQKEKEWDGTGTEGQDDIRPALMRCC